MQKKLLPLAIAGVLAAPSAVLADVTAASGVNIYGQLHASWDFVDMDKASDSSDDNTAVFRNSRVGFKGSENLSGDLKANWQVETKVDTDDDAMELRNSYVGLSGKQWGEIRLGKHDTPYKMATGKLDIFTDTIADYNNVIGAVSGYNDANTNNAYDAGEALYGVRFDQRPSQTVIYFTPDFNGLQAAIGRQSYSRDEAAGVDESDAWSLMGKYEQGGLLASVAYETHSGEFSTSNTDEMDAWKVGLGYTLGDSKIGFVYEAIESDASNSAQSRDAFHLNFSQAFGPSVLKLAYSKAEESDAANANDGADIWTIGLDHKVSKHTTLYALYASLDNDEGGNYNLYSGSNAGEYYNEATGGIGEDADGFSVGIIHKF